MAKTKNAVEAALAVEMQPIFDGVEMPDNLVRVQQTAPDREPTPRPVALVIGKKLHPDDPDEIPIAPVAQASPAPRFIHDNERAPAGLRRYKVRATNLGEQPTRYTLAADESQAVAHYLKATGIGALLAAIPEDLRPKPQLSVTALRD